MKYPKKANPSQSGAPIANIDDSLGLDINQQLSQQREQYQHAQNQLLARHKRQLQPQQIESLLDD